MQKKRKSGFFIGELAERTGVSRDTIRYYESTGLLPEPERTESGYRLYESDDVERLRFVGRAQALGLTLEEISEVLELVREGREPCAHVRVALEGHLEDTRERIRRLRALEERLEGALAEARSTPDDGGCRCRIIEDAAGRDSAAERSA